VAVFADSLGHSQSTLAILAHLWRAKSLMARYMEPYLRIFVGNGFEDHFIGGNSGENMYLTKEGYVNNHRN
jgi:hypothetical protein